MARITKILPNGEADVYRSVPFERNDQWTQILGPIPSHTEGDEQETGPESEYILQRLIELYPDILPWHDLQESPEEGQASVCVVCQGVSSVATDILLVERTKTGTGRFVIVETKLVKNPEIHRAVIGQILEYAARLTSSETLGALENRAKNYWRKRGTKFKGEFADEMSRRFGEKWKEDVWNTACENLKRRELRLLIVSDRLPEDLRLAVTFLPSNVLLSGVEVQPHAGREKRELFVTGANSVKGVASEDISSAVRKYFAGICLSYVQVRLTKDGYVLAETFDRGKSTAPTPVRSYHDHLKTLGAETVPGRVLESLRARTLGTHGYVREGEKSLTFRLWGMPGLNAREANGELDLQFWASDAVAHRKDRRDDVVKLFLKRFGSQDLWKRGGQYTFYLRHITRNSDLEESMQLVQQIEALYNELHKMEGKPETAP